MKDESWEVSVPSGDRRVDHFVKQELSKIIETDLAAYIETPQYKKLSEIEQETVLVGMLEKARKAAKASAESKYIGTLGKEEEFNPFGRVAWMKISGRARKLAERFYNEQQKKEYIRLYGSLLGFKPKSIYQLRNFSEAAIVGRNLESKFKNP